MRTDNTGERYESMVRELASDLAALVESGDLTDVEANEWLVSKQEQWKGAYNG